MVEVDVQLLVGAAATVFLALMFFGVVVLWDVALALRSVGDKIDKLEDNIDDDLMDIGHALDGISSTPGGGGTQLHLSGGTISSGPESRPQAQTQGQEQEQGQGQGQPAQSPQGAQPQAEGADSSYQHQPAHQPPRADGAAEQSPETTATQADDVDANEPADDVDDVADADGPEPESTPAADESDPKPVHPRAKRSRGRFVTSPDRTPWYATTLDREAIREAQSPIAGALTDGSVDESEIIAVGPSEPVETDEATESADAAVGDVPATDASRADEPVAEDEANEGDREPADESAAAETGADVLAFDEDEADDGDEDESGERDEAEAHDSDGTEVDESDGADADTGSETETDDDEQPDADTHGAETDADAERPTADERSQSAETGLEPADETTLEVSGGDDAPDALKTVDEGETAVEPAGDETSDEAADDEPTADDAFEPASADQSPFGDVAAFDFETDLEDETDVTVAEAVDTINEEAPAPELSSHKFDVTAEVHRSDDGTEDDDGDGDGAVLVFEFDTDTVDISGSTKRLLQYQMRSFADRESTPEGDVTIGRDRIVIEVPDTDGNAVKRWGEAAVSIIDRTLYLSDNSSGEN